jgi:hypothetical protein
VLGIGYDIKKEEIEFKAVQRGFELVGRVDGASHQAGGSRRRRCEELFTCSPSIDTRAVGQILHLKGKAQADSMARIRSFFYTPSLV